MSKCQRILCMSFSRIIIIIIIDSKSPQVSGLSLVFWPILTSCCLDDLHSSCYFQVPQSLSQSIGDSSDRTNYIGYLHQLHILQLFNSLSRFRYSSLFCLSSVLLSSQPEGQSPLFGRIYFLLIITRSDRLTNILLLL